MAAGRGSVTVRGGIDLPAFARLYELRAPRIGWLLGAGASAAAGVATASQATWDWKARIYATEKRVRYVALDLADPLLRDRIQRFFDLEGGNPPRDAEAEYSFYFERAYPRPEDRRRYLDQLIADAQPGFGHLGLAALMMLGKIGVVWTTNFDRLVEDAAAQVMKTTRNLTTSTTGDPAIALQALRDERFPLLVKLHGDFQSEKLKNTTAELQSQDAQFREALRRSAGRYGLAVVGYSGRDASVMEALHAGLDEVSPYPNGLYWFARAADEPLPVVSALVDAAVAKGVDAHLIRFTSFDELVSTLLSPFVVPKDIDAVLRLTKPPERLSPFALSKRTTGTFPVLRLNALLVERYPTTARRVGAPTVGGTREIKELVNAAGADVIAQRRHDGVIAFGRDDEVRRVFSAAGIAEWDLAPIDPIGGPPGDLGLLYDTVSRAIARRSPLLEGRHRLSVDPGREKDAALADLRVAAEGKLTGTIPDTMLHWSEGVQISLEVKLGKLWLVFVPTIVADLPPKPPAGAPIADVDAWTKLRAARGDFSAKRLANRYNKRAHAFVTAWAHLLAGGGTDSAAFGLDANEGLDAVFAIDATTAFARYGS
jgi:hypothetical protein